MIMMPRPHPRRARSRLVPLVLAALPACSTLADTPDPEECRSDDDCAANLVCAVDQGRCLPGNEAAPRAHLGFDIRESVAGTVRYRVEVNGCDCTIEEEENIRELALRRSRVSQLFFLTAYAAEDPPDDLMDDALLPAAFELTQPSRLGQDPSPQVGRTDHPTYANAEMMMTVVPTVLRWPRYHPLDRDVPSDLVLWTVEPTNGLASRWLGLLPPRTDNDQPCTVDSDCCEPKGDCNPAPNFCDTEVGECTAVGQPEWTYELTYDPRCSRSFAGSVRSIDPVTNTLGAPLENATVSLRYADRATGERIGTSVFNPDRSLACSEDADCGSPDMFCDEATSECVVALANRSANRGSTTDAAGWFDTEIYTYCDAQPNAGGLLRRFALTVKPEGPRPTVEYLIEADYGPPQGMDFPAPQPLCVPDWGAGQTLELALVGQPRALAGTDGEYTCCDVSCLPVTAEDASAGPLPSPESCDGTTAGAVSPPQLVSHFVVDDLAAWAEVDCTLPNPDGQGRVGSLELKSTCGAAGEPCLVNDVVVGTAEEPRRYDVRVEFKPGSVLASGDFSFELGPGVPPRQTLTLSPRVLVTGVVDVDAAVCARRPVGADCAAREAVVMAERLRLPGEPEGSVPGPYFHDVSTFYDPVAGRDGAFVLPLDPEGVYVVTALPEAGAEGGPAAYTLVDLRDITTTTLEPLRLVLEDGVVVTLRLEQFDQRTTVTPLDRGSHLAPGKTLELPDSNPPTIVDLDEIGACWTPFGEGPQACKIRRLIPPGNQLSRTQVGLVRFTARRSDAAQCPVRCPMSPPSE